MIKYNDLANIVSLSEDGDKLYSKVIKLNSNLTLQPFEKKYLTSQIVLDCDNKNVICFVDSDVDGNEYNDDNKWFLYTAINGDDSAYNLIMINLTDKDIELKANDTIGVMEAYINYSDNQINPETITINDLGDNIYTLKGMRVYDADKTVKNIEYSKSDDKEEIIITL